MCERFPNRAALPTSVLADGASPGGPPNFEVESLRWKVMAMTYPQTEFSPPTGSTRIVLVRHGQSVPLVGDEPFAVVDGHGDPPLSPRGIMQADRVAERLRGEDIAAIYASTLTRTQQSAAPLAVRCELEVRIEHDLREVFLGIGEAGRFRIMVQEEHPAVMAVQASKEWGEIPGAETNLQLTDRVVGALDRIHLHHRDEAVVVFCHGGVIGAAVGHVLSVNPFRMSGARNGSITEIVRTPTDWILRSFNDASHIGSLFSDHDPSDLG